jgi:lipid-A-disaccharide synthase
MDSFADFSFCCKVSNFHPMKYYLIAGEASGDLHGSNLIKELKALDGGAVIRAWGGDLMQAAGAEVVKHYKDLAFMGFAEVIKNLPTIFRNLKFCKEDITAFGPDVLVLIDYPGFNLRIAKWAKEAGLKVIYYISPQVWAWKESRVKGIKKSVDKMLVILPFEKEFYHRWSYKVEYIGHPLAEVINEALKYREELIPLSSKPVIAIKKLPLMLAAAKAFPHYDFVVAQAPSLEDHFYNEFLKDYPQVLTVKNKTYNLLMQSAAALVTSGTATLETALFGVPQVVCYKGSAVSYTIAKRLIKIKYISLVNLIMDKPVVTELIQHQLTTENIIKELKALFTESKAAQIREDYKALKALLQQGGNASARAAQEIVGFLQATA